MADNTKVKRIGDSSKTVSSSSSEEEQEGNPCKISDCSDLYDLINYSLSKPDEDTLVQTHVSEHVNDNQYEQTRTVRTLTTVTTTRVSILDFDEPSDPIGGSESSDPIGGSESASGAGSGEQSPTPDVASKHCVKNGKKEYSHESSPTSSGHVSPINLDDSGIVQGVVSASASTDLDSLETAYVMPEKVEEIVITSTNGSFIKSNMLPDEHKVFDPLLTIVDDDDDVDLHEPPIYEEQLVESPDQTENATEDSLEINKTSNDAAVECQEFSFDENKSEESFVQPLVLDERRGSDDSGTGAEELPTNVVGSDKLSSVGSDNISTEVVENKLVEFETVDADEGCCGVTEHDQEQLFLPDDNSPLCPAIDITYSHESSHSNSYSGSSDELDDYAINDKKTDANTKVSTVSYSKTTDVVETTTTTTVQQVNNTVHSEEKTSPQPVMPDASPEKEINKEVIQTGISIKQLKSVYTGKTSPNDEPQNQQYKETIDTGVSLVNLKANYCEITKAEDKSPKKEVFETGVSIKALKSSFNEYEFSEEDGVKIDRAKVTRSFSQSQENFPLYALLDSNDVASFDEKSKSCRICGKMVFEMEKIKAEKSVFHKTCFRCQECGKQLGLDTYSSHEGILYCKPHFKMLFQPKAKFDEEPKIPRRKHEMIIRENIPAELPPDVVRSADKPDYGLNEIPNLKNIKSRFENADDDDDAPALNLAPVRRSESIATRMAKFQEQAEMAENGIHEDSSSDDEQERDPSIVHSSRKKEKVQVVFSGMSELKNQWESGAPSSKEERARERQEELNRLRQRICSHGKGSLKSRYENALEEAQKSPTRYEVFDTVNGEARTNSIKEKFEKGELLSEHEIEKTERMKSEKEEDLSVFNEQGTGVNARSIFRQMDENTAKSPTTPTSVNRSPSMRSHEIFGMDRSISGEVVKHGEPVDETVIDTTVITEKFKYFENFEQNKPQDRKVFKMTPPREIVKEESPEPVMPRDPNVVRSGDIYEDDTAIVSDTVRKMRNKFREMENFSEVDTSQGMGPKPLKRITPPREFTKDDSEDNSKENPRDPNIIRACDKIEDEFLIHANKQNGTGAKTLRARFEHWEEYNKNEDDDSSDDENNQKNSEEAKPEPETAKNLCAKFETLNDSSANDVRKPKMKINRFIETAGNDECDVCCKRVYPVERLDVSGHKLHKTCFRCSHCGNILRMDNYTSSEGVLYCTPHFKQLFITKGNYDEGFGREQHKERWNHSRSSSPSSKDNGGHFFTDENSEDLVA